MFIPDKIYLNCGSDLLQGSIKTDRTNTGTISSHCIALKYDVKGYCVPFLQSKKMIFSSGVKNSSLYKELKWYLLGSGSNNDLVKMGVKFWSDWASKDGHLGPLYGFQWRKCPAMITSFNDMQKVPNYRNIIFPKATKEEIIGVMNNHYINDFLDQAYNCNMKEQQLYKMWRNMIVQVFHDDKYTIDKEWLSYPQFRHDVEYMIGYHNIFLNPMCTFVYLSCLYFNCMHYSKNTCAFIPSSMPYLVFNETDEPFVMRPRLYHDQFADLIDTMKADPFSRRLIINSWNVSMLHMMKLPPCHFTFQFLNKEVNGQLYTSLNLIMRSNDFCVGHPFNIAQYAMLLFVVCKLCNTYPDTLYFYGGDVHVYQNHKDIFEQQITLLNSTDLEQNSVVKMYISNTDNVNYYRFDFMEQLDIDFDDVKFMSEIKPHYKYPIAV
ncbi:MAG: hypothetical protein KDH96_02765 [Candidatus Riesia sp.]|nr:hypothetical protein [Candidatus Riesia sp.]